MDGAYPQNLFPSSPTGRLVDTYTYVLDGCHRETTVAMLCNVCSQMSQAVLSRQLVWGDHHRTLVSLLDAAEAGCYICEFTRQRLLEFDNRDNCRVDKFTFRQYKYGASSQVLLDMEVFFGQEESRECLCFWAAPTRGFATTEGEKIRKREGCIPQAEGVIKIGEWMDLCLREHKGTRCRKNAATQPSSYPSRLLELGPSSFRVLRTAVDRPRGPYTTLSYCWGPNPEFLRLTAWNLKELEAGVSTSQLPIAFREAISVIQALSFRYFWIDSLCIIQSGPGSVEDWETESARMHQIYSDSALTLALTCVASPYQSIFNQARTRKTAMPPFEIKADSGQPDPVAGALTIMSQDYFVHSLYEQPLGYRAWALQERVMATRVVSFGLGELFWDCAELATASESIPGGLQATQIGTAQIGTAVGIFNLAKKTIPDGRNGSNYNELAETWRSLLHEYTTRKLTYPKTDKLVALAAIAHEIGNAMDDVYIAGHFWKTLPSSLNWVLKEQTGSSFQRVGGRARRIFWSEKPDAQDISPRTPSWSWASMDGPIFFERAVIPSDGQLAEAVSYTLEMANEVNPTGPCISASISIRAYCTEIEWQSENEPVMVARTDSWALDNIWFDVDLDEPEIRREKGSKSLLIAIKDCIWLQQWAGLVVEGVTHEGRIMYRRIGHFVISGVNIEGSTWWDERISIFGEEKKLVELV